MAPMHENNERVGVTHVEVASALPSFSVSSSVSGAKPQAHFPRIDAHLVKPEVSRFELIRGREVDVSGAEPPHADAQARLAFLIAAHVAVGFVVSTELLTRMAASSDFATDVCVRKDGVDPLTDSRYLEEIAFEIVNTQRKRDVTDKAEDMVCRGVRRVLAIFVKTGRVAEWSATEGKFVEFEADAVISDPVFVRPIPVQALIDGAVGENEAALALVAKGNPALMKRERAAEQKGRKKGRAEGRKVGLDEGRKKGLDEGLKKGLDEGRKLGLDEGLDVGRKLLLGIVEMRAGRVSSDIRRRIESADAHTVQVWGQRLLAGALFDDVFRIP